MVLGPTTYISGSIGGSKGIRGLKPRLNFFRHVFSSMVPDTETSIGVIFCIALQINHFLRRHKDKIIKYKAYFAEFGQSECVYFTINETSNKEVFT